MASSHSPKIVTDGLVLCLDAGDGKSYGGSGSTWTDRSGNGNSGALTNGVTFSSDNGGCIVYDGAGDVVTVTRNSSLSPTDEITQEAWFNLDATGGRVYIGLQYGTSSQNSYALWNANSTTWNGLIRNSSGMNIIQYTRTVNTSNWYHFVHTYDGSNQKLYINSELIKTQVTTGSITYDSNNTEITIGADYNGSGYNTGITAVVDGKQPIARIYNKALTASEVLQNYNATKGRFS